MSKNIKYHHSEDITIEFLPITDFDSHLDELLALTQLFFDKKPKREYFDRLRNTKQPLIIVARLQDNTIIGCKIGFQISNDTYYSWIGGVHPDHRRKGIAQSMMELQLDWCLDNKFKTIRTKTLIHNMPMYTLNFMNGYHVIGNEISSTHGPKLILSKTLQPLHSD